MFAMSYGAAFGAIQQIPQIVPGTAGSPRDGAGPATPPQARLIEQGVASDVTKVQEVGGLVGRVLLAVLAVVIVSRQRLIRMFQIPGLIVMPVVFGVDRDIQPQLVVCRGLFRRASVPSPSSVSGGTTCRGCIPIHLRGTGESFAANIGGRLIGTSFAWVTATLAVTPDRAYAPDQSGAGGGGVGFSVYLVGLIASFFLPEPPRDELPE